jgi:hypothetical protein
MKIPKTLKIGGLIYKIKIERLDDDHGKMSRVYQTIKVDSDLPEPERIVTLIHEVIHVMNGQIKEDMVEALAHQAYQILKDNKFIK